MSHPTETDLHDDTTEQLNLVWLYRLILAVLLMSILITSMKLALQTQQRHQTYQEINRLKRELTAMQVEESRLIIEQQMYSATPQVARRSVGQLNMYYPTTNEQIRGELVENSEQGVPHD